MDKYFQSLYLATLLVSNLSPDKNNSANRIRLSERDFIKKEIEFWKEYFYKKLTL